MNLLCSDKTATLAKGELQLHFIQDMKYYADGKSLDALLEGIKGKRKSLANNEYIQKKIRNISI
jgi:hypothetical protein